MQRVLFTIPVAGGLPVFGYGLFLMLGFVAALLIAYWRGKKRGISSDAIIDVAILAIFAGVIGARLAYLLLDYTPQNGNYGTLAEWLAVWQGGLTFQGGLFLALPAVYVYLKRKKISVPVMFDVFAPALAVGVGFGRLGCLLNGCCWGKPAPHGSWFGLLFPDHIESMLEQQWLYRSHPDHSSARLERLGYPPATLPPIPIYATQIVSALGLFAIGLLLIWLEKRRPHRLPGQTIVWFLFLYGLGRFIIEFYRDDTPLRYGFGPFPGLRLGQWLALAMILAAALWQWRLNLQAAGDQSVPPASEPHDKPSGGNGYAAK